MRKKGMLLIILLMAVGFAAVSTTLFLNGNTDILANQDDFNVYFSDVYINGNQDKSVIKSDRVIEFNTEFSKVGQEYILDYEVTNGSKNYDAELVMNCVSSSEYLSVTNDFDDDTILSSMDYRIGRLVVEQTKSYVGEELEVTIKCTIDANASERTSLGIFKEKEIEVEAIDANDSLVDASAYQISGEAKDNLYDLLVESNNIDDSVSVRSFIQLDSENINDISKATFNMSPVATTGDNIIILNFNKVTSDWELVSLNEVDLNKEVIVDFSDIEVIPFATQNNDGSLEIKLSTVTFNGNGGTSNESIRSLIYNQAIGELPTATRTGYEFNGWYTKTSDGEKVDSNYKVKGNITLYALWNVNNYNVSVINSGNGNVGVSSLIVPYGGTKTFTVKPNSGYYLSSVSCTGNYTVSGFTTGIDAISTQTVTVKSNAAQTGVCTATFAIICPYSVGQVWNYTANGNNAQTFTTPCTGNYKVELWGSSGKVNDYTIAGSVGQGAYTAGNINLTRAKELYVYVGSPGYMGGGYGETAGGGATDIRLVKSSWNTFNSLKSRIMVAAGGGGGVYNIHATLVATGHGGGLNGYTANATIANHEYTTGYSGGGATQTAGGSTGIYGGSAYPYVSAMVGSFGAGGYDSNKHSSSGGGGGYYGGGHGRHPGGTWSGGGGGSSFISGHAGCNAIAESSTSTNIVHTGSSIHYSGYKFTNTKMIDGAGYTWTTSRESYTGMPNAMGGTMSGNSGSGYARFTLVSITNPN